MKYSIYNEEAHKKGYAAFLVKDLSFEEIIKDGERFYKPSKDLGEGFVYQINPVPGVQIFYSF